MGKSKRDYRRGASAGNFESYVPTETPQSYGEKSRTTYTRRDDRRDENGDTGRHRRRPQRQPRERVADPIAVYIAGVFADQAKEFLASPAEDRYSAANGLFRLDERPMELDLGNEDGTHLYAYDVDRSVRVDRDDPEKLRHMSAAFIINNMDTGVPAYFVYARITPEGNYNVRVVPQGEKGPDYRSIAVVDSRDTSPVVVEDNAQ